MVNERLFREEVIAERQTQWLGTVLLTPRLSYGLFAAFALLATVAVLALLFLGSYSRKARIAGWLVPQKGLVQAYAPQSAVITRIFVVEGAEVRAGDALLVLSTELRSAARGSMQGEIASRLQMRRSSLLQVRHQLGSLSGQRSRSLVARIESLQSEMLQLDKSIALQAERVLLAKNSETRNREIHERGLISEQELQVVSGLRLEQESKLSDLKRTKITSERELLAMNADLQDLPLKSQTDVSAVDRDIAAVEQDLAEVESKREIVIPAPESGTVTSVQAEVGGRADPSVPLVSIIPAGSKLEAHLLAPSRSIGFLRPGQRVLLRYEAYPYQKFGHYEGTVSSISRSAVNPGELPQQLAGLTRLTGTNEPVYRITVSLNRQDVIVYGKPVSLQPGMQLEADVLIERRRLVEWVLDPLFTLTGKLKS